MLRLKNTLCVLVVILLALISTSSAAVPQLINYQGVLTDSLGNNVNDTVDITYTIYDAPSSGSTVWTETQTSIVVNDGQFNVFLGSVTQLIDTVFNDTVRYLGIQVNSDPEISPRTRLVSMAYSYRTGTVDGASGGHITSKVNIGPNNDNSGTGAFVAGELDTASGDYSVVSGGLFNVASGTKSVVSGGTLNKADSTYAVVGGGWANRAGHWNSTVGGGGFSKAEGWSSTVAGGWVNRASDTGAVVAGGGNNNARGKYSFVGGGGGTLEADSNSAQGINSAIVGGRGNFATGLESVIGGGAGNVASGPNTTISGGGANSATSDLGTVGGGAGNDATGHSSTIGGGALNIAEGFLSTVGGGAKNYARGDYSVIAGGNSIFPTDSMLAGGDYSTIGGGRLNVAKGDYSTISGGSDNIASGYTSAVGGGVLNTASQDGATVPGGELNAATGIFSFAAGFRAKANHAGTFVWADSLASDFTSTGNNQFLIRASGGVGIGTNSPTVQLEVTGTIYSTSGGFKFPDGSTQSSAASVGDVAGDGGKIGTTLGANASISQTLMNLNGRGSMGTYGTNHAFRLICTSDFLEYFIELYNQNTNTWTYQDGTLGTGGTHNVTGLSSNPGTTVKVLLSDSNDDYIATWTGVYWNSRFSGTWVTSHQ